MHLAHLPSHLGRSVSTKMPPFQAPPGYVWQYEIDGLSGLGRFKLRKIFRAITAPIRKVAQVAQKAVKSVVKSKVFKVAAIATAAWFAAPWFISLAKTIGTAAATALVKSKAPGALPENVIAEQTSATQMPDWLADTAKTAIPMYIAKRQADELAARQAEELKLRRLDEEKQYQASVTANQNAIQQQRYESEQRRMEQQNSTAGDTNKWIVPAAIGGAALLLLTTLSNR